MIGGSRRQLSVQNNNILVCAPGERERERERVDLMDSHGRWKGPAFKLTSPSALHPGSYVGRGNRCEWAAGICPSRSSSSTTTWWTTPTRLTPVSHTCTLAVWLAWTGTLWTQRRCCRLRARARRRLSRRRERGSRGTIRSRSSLARQTPRRRERRDGTVLALHRRLAQIAVCHTSQ